MEEKDILDILGYTMSELGAILDKNGNYIESAEYDGHKVESNITRENHEKYVNEQNRLSKIGFNYNPNDVDNKYTQERIAIAKDNLKRHQSDPTVSLPEDVDNDPIYNRAFRDINEETTDDFKYASIGTMVESAEEGTILADIDDSEDKELFKIIEKRIKDIEKIDPDADTRARERRESDEVVVGTDDEGKPIMKQKPGEDANIFKKGLYSLQKGTSDALDWMLETLSPTGAGMKSELLQKEYEKLQEEKRKLLKPVAAKKLEAINEKIAELEKEREPISYWSTDTDKYLWAIKKLERQKNNLEDYINDDKINGNIFTVDNLADWASAGIYDAWATWKYEARLRDKIEEGKEITDADMAIIESSILDSEVANLGLKQKWLNDITGGTAESVKFLGFSAGGRLVGKAAGKAVAKGLAGKSATLNKTLRYATDNAVQVALHPYSYKYAFQKHAGEFDIIDGEVVAGQRLYDVTKEKNKLIIEDYEDAIEQARANNDNETAESLAKELNQVREFDDALKQPSGYAGNLAYGITEVLKETLSENFGGDLLHGASALAGKSIRRTALGRSLANNKIIKAGTRLDKMVSAGKTAFNRSLAPAGKKIIGSNTEEMFEEILVQLTPSYGTTWDEYKEQVAQLKEGSFYAQVAAQTLLMQQGFKGVGLAKQKYKILTSMDKSERQKRKEIKDLYKELGKRGLKQSEFNEVMMKAGHGDFSTEEYNTQIKKMKSQGLIVEANELERTKIYKQAVAAQQQGLLPEFLKAVNKAQYNKNLAPETIANLTALKTELREIASDDNTYVNSQEVIDIKSRKRFAEKTLDQLETSKANINYLEAEDEFSQLVKKKMPDVDMSLADFYEKGSTETIDYVRKNFDKLSDNLQQALMTEVYASKTKESIKNIDKHLKQVTSYSHQLKLETEQDYLTYLNDINKQVFNRNITAQQFDNLIKKIPAKKQKGISKSRLEELHSTISLNLKKQELSKVQTKKDDEVVDETIDETPEVNPLDNSTKDTLTSIAMNIAKQTPIDELDTDEDGSPIINNDDLFMIPSEEMSNGLAEWANIFKAEENRDATFQDYFDNSMKALDNDKSAFDKSSLRMIGEAWEQAGLGKSNWEKVYDDNYTSSVAYNRNLLQRFLAPKETTEEVTKEQIKSADKEQQKVSTPAGINPMTGEPIKVTPVDGKTTVITAKANYSALEYKNKRTPETDTKGNRVLVYTKEDVVDESEVPIFNENSFVDMKPLLHPDKNNPGDKLIPVITSENDWGHPALRVSVNDPVTGEVTEYVTFPDWIKRNQPKGMSLEDFQKTEAYIAKVPMYYQDAEGNKVAFVPDVDWYNGLSIRDTSKESGEVVDLNNLTESHKLVIQEGKNNAMATRRGIINGSITEMTITSKQGSPLIKIAKTNKNGDQVLPKPLEQAAPDNKIIWWKGNRFVDLDGVSLDESHEIININEILNYINPDTGERGKSPSTWYLSPVNKTDKKQRFRAIQLVGVSSDGASAHQDDVATAKFIAAANQMLQFGTTKHGISAEEAQSVREQIKELTGIDIANFDNSINLVNSLVALKDPNTGRVYPANDKAVPLTAKAKGYFIDALFAKSHQIQYNVIQSTNLVANKSAGLKITRTDTGMKVEKVADTYEDFLKKRLGTNVVSYNMGTTENPAYTASVQPMIKLEPNTVEQTVEIQQEDVVQKDEIQDALDFFESLGGIEETTDELIPSLQTTAEIEQALNIIPGLTLDQQHDITNHVLSMIASSYEISNEMTLKEFRDAIKAELQSYLTKLSNDIKTHKNKAESIYKEDPLSNKEKLEAIIRTADSRLSQIKVIEDHFNVFFKKAYMEGMRKGFVSSDIKTSDDLAREIKDNLEDEMYIKDFYKSSNETIHKQKISSKLKRLFATISNGQKGFLGVPKYESYDAMYNTLATLIASPLPTDPNFEAMMERLEYYAPSFPWMKPLIQKLKAADNDIKNSLVVNMYKYAANAKFVMILSDKTGVEGEVWFSNANNIKQKIKESWASNFKRSTITNGNTLNTEKLGLLWKQWESWGHNKAEQSDEVLRKWLSEFGITLSDGTWRELKEGKFVTGIGKRKRLVSFNDLFYSVKNERNDMLFSNLANFARTFKDSPQNSLDYVSNKKSYHPYEDMNNIMSTLIEMESRHNTTLINITRRDGDKTVSELVFPSFFFDNMRKLMVDAQNDDKAYLNYLQTLAFSKDNHVLNMLMNNKAFADAFNYGEVGLMSMKKRFGNTPRYGKIDEISPVDYMFHQRAMFQFMKNEKIDEEKFGFKMRIGNMSTPTNSDKGRMMLMKTAVFDIFGNKEAIDKNGKFSNDLKEMLYQTLIVPELNRILAHDDVDIKNYNQGAVRFNLMPILNVLTNEDGITTLDFIHADERPTAEQFKEKFFDKITSYLEESIGEEVNENITDISEFISGKNDEFNNKSYISRREGSNIEKATLAEFDYVINSMVANMTTFQLIAGDPALYFDGKVKNDIYSTDVNDQTEISKALGVNMGKRLALMIAPGNVLANSGGEKYMQLFLEDRREPAGNLEQLAAAHYGSKILKEKHNDRTYRDHLRDLVAGTISDENLKHLESRFAKIKDYFSIETTDAQEYTTIKEHLRVLEGLGRITSEQAETYERKLMGENLTEKELQSVTDVILQPLKPVYTGAVDSKGIRRVMYIKSSSFPLIPQLVKGTELEPLMNKMMDLESKHQMTVRASYQSANKVGAMSQPINPFDADSLARLDEINDETGLPSQSMTLDRENFKIQQDVPYKETNMVSMGTQIFKLLFGDGITDIDGFELDGKKMNGQELKEEFFNTFSTIIGIQKDRLLSSLAIDENYESENSERSAMKLYNLLLAEAESRGFSENDKKALFPYYITQPDGTRKYHFTTPLWFSGNSNKFESMLNAIVGNKIFKQKLPGNSFVVGSKAGLKLKEGIENIQGNNVVFIGDYRGGELGPNEILAPAKFKMPTRVVKKPAVIKDGKVVTPAKVEMVDKVIDLFKKNKYGKYIYIKPTDNGFVINEKEIDPAVLEGFGFRTPTSSHGSASNLKIVGFIPSEMGDLIITPKNFITQMGQDFDIDKLTAYGYHVYNNQGRIEKFNEDHKEFILYEARKNASDRNKINSLMQGLLAQKDEETGAFENDPDLFDINEELTEEEILQRVEEKVNLKLAQNRFVDIHRAVYNNPRAEVQKKITKVLSMEHTENQAEAIDGMAQIGISDVNLLSPKYQMNKMIAGSTGSNAIAIYAKGVTLNSLMQQNETLNALQEEVTVNGETETRQKSVVIGNLASNGTMGLKTALAVTNATPTEVKLVRGVSEALDERVQTAVDNEKAQILGRVGITHITNVAVDNLLLHLGIDTERRVISKSEYDASNPFHKMTNIDGEDVYHTDYSIPYLLHSQPIIKEYFKRLKNSRGVLQDFQANVNDAIKDELLAGYVSTDETFSKNFTGENLVNQIATNRIDSDFQKEILLTYMDLVTNAGNVKEIQDVADMSTLGKSMWELKDKINKFISLPTNTSISNVTDLLGIFSTEKGDLKIGNVYFTPTTNQGVMVGTAMSMGRHLFFDYFPYYDSYIESVMSSIHSKSTRPANTVEFNEMVFQEMKKYITSSNDTGLFLDSATNERKQLLFDTDKNLSVSTYIASLFNNNNKEFSEGIKAMNNNAFLTALIYEKGDEGRPNLVKFDNTEVAHVSEEHFHAAFKELFVKNLPLPPRSNGQPYSTRELAQDMVAYSYVVGGIVREAIEFHRFIPIEYYQDVGALSKLQQYDTLVSNWGEKGTLANFEEQFFQNNPDTAFQLDKADRDKAKFQKDGTLYYEESMDSYPPYISFRNKTKSKLKQDKWSLYKNVGGNKYQKIDVLGDFGMSEYDPSTSRMTSLIEKPTPVSTDPVGTLFNRPGKTTSSFVVSNTDTPQTLLEKIKGQQFSYNPSLSKVAEILLEMFPEQAKQKNIAIMHDITDADGKYNPKTQTITLNMAKTKMAETFVHEFIHSVTSDYINPHFDIDGNILGTAPKEVVALNILKSEYNEQMKKKYGAEYSEFLRKYQAWRGGAKNITFTERERSVFYPTINTKEFLAVALSNNREFLNEASQIPYKKSGMTIKDKFIKILDAILDKIAGKETNLAQEILGSSLTLLDTVADNKIKQEVSVEEMQKLAPVKTAFGQIVDDSHVIKQDDVFAEETATDKPILKLGENFAYLTSKNEVLRRDEVEYMMDEIKKEYLMYNMHSDDINNRQYKFAVDELRKRGYELDPSGHRFTKGGVDATTLAYPANYKKPSTSSPFGNIVTDDSDIKDLPDCI